MAPQIEQQAELLRRTVEENERALAQARATLEQAWRPDDWPVHELSAAEAKAIAGMRRARLEIRAQTRQVHALVARLPRAS